ncbi:unnamed protein product [Cylindrotheca closterium]|uniref:Uncharacterized protein n=1 Tax=Cylindrotheca closterium TaxID=2856 RepID=A0AAD2CSK1_9STRA|nr:unnamed protein product [Cylindrotheca closterium]
MTMTKWCLFILLSWQLYPTESTGSNTSQIHQAPTREEEDFQNHHDHDYNVTEYWFNCTIDHFNFRPTTVPTFGLRYFVNDDYYTPNGPVFFYAGNEADILQFVKNSGFMFEAAQEFGAMVVFAEHRYYGKSNPFGDEYALGKGYNISFLSVEQAMQDYNQLNLHMRRKWKMPAGLSTPFIVFGGSYGGNLALWMRLKNPNLWAGAVASSVTPLKHLLRETNGFTRIETEAYGNVSKECPDLVRQGWKELYELAKEDPGKEVIAEALHLCDKHHVNPSNIHGWISGALETMVQYGYPYPTNFYNPVPGYPFKVACENMIKGETGLGALYAAAAIYYNYTGQAGDCFDFGSILEASRKHWKRHGRFDYLAKITTDMGNNAMDDMSTLMKGRILTSLQDATDHAWGYQTCTEVYQPMPTDGVTDFELPYQPDQESYFANCQETWGVTPRPNWEEMYFMGIDIGSGSNIFITNGQVDPWRAAGITELPKGSNPSIVTRTIAMGAHHFDLRGAHPMDPPAVTAVRNEEKEHMRKWIAEWAENHS